MFWAFEGCNTGVCLLFFFCFSFFPFNSLADSKLFDASQYEFFGQHAVEGVELGGLENDKDDIPVFGSVDDEYQLFEREEVYIFPLWSCNELVSVLCFHSILSCIIFLMVLELFIKKINGQKEEEQTLPCATRS